MTDDPRSLAARLIAASPLAMTIADARSRTLDRRRKLLAYAPMGSTGAEPDFTAPAPMPVLDAPVSFAKDFWSKRRAPDANDAPPKAKVRTPQGRKPLGDLPLEANRFRVIDGDGGDSET
jgi:hypothetical protein